MDVLCYVIIFSMLSCASSASFSRRHLSQASVTDGSPFFPSDSTFSPPPPPNATTFATFPANISALVLPRSPKQNTASRTVLIPVISAVVAVATTIGLVLFLYRRWRGKMRYLKDDSKSLASDISQTELTSCPPQRNKLSVVCSTSDVLYLGNVVTSGSGFVKPESPEICSLPPLPARSFPNHNSETNTFTDDEEDDDFYSPLASLAGQERQRSNPYSNCSCSSSTSPEMSPSVMNSPPTSSTAPQWSTQNPQSPSPERWVRNDKSYEPSQRMFNLRNQNLGFPRISSASTSPERGTIRTPDAYARSSMYSSVSTTPDRFFRKILESSPPRLNDFNRNVKSLFLSSTSASPTRDFCIDISKSATTEQSQSAAVPPPPPQRPPPTIPEPPPLIPPSQSFMVQKPGKKLSFSELPQSSLAATTTDRPQIFRPSSCRKNTWDNHKFNSSNANSKQRSQSCDLPMLNTENIVLEALKNGHYEALGVQLLRNGCRED